MKNAYVKVRNVDGTLNKPAITLEPTKPENIWYKRIQEENGTETETKVKVTISTDSKVADYIYYTAIGAHTDTEHQEENPVSGKKVEFTITESGTTTITARVGRIKEGTRYSSNPSTEVVKLDNIKPEITKINLSPKPGAADSQNRRMDNRKRKSNNRSKRQ